MKNAFSPEAVAFAIEKSKSNGQNLFSLTQKDKGYDSRVRAKLNGKKIILKEFLQRIIDSHPPFLEYLNEYENEQNAGTERLEEKIDQMMVMIRDIQKRLLNIESDTEWKKDYLETMKSILKKNSII